jgi:hypothetical protein
VPDHRGALDAPLVQQRQDVGHRVVDPVRRDVLGPVAVAEPAQVGRDHPVPGRDEGPDLGAPQRRAVREAVQQHHGGPLPRVEHGQGDVRQGDADRRGEGGHAVSRPAAGTTCASTARATASLARKLRAFVFGRVNAPGMRTLVWGPIAKRVGWASPSSSTRR